jgi:hypothetical protein
MKMKKEVMDFFVSQMINVRSIRDWFVKKLVGVKRIMGGMLNEVFVVRDI